MSLVFWSFTLVRQGDRDGRREKAGDMTTDLLQGFCPESDPRVQ